ncbi:sensor histidine kinase [Lysobacter sp. CA196]|uniref:sensor histidine kinase n=1 Tax=Lysobacter sp. CA196 TaxID=3455606 RepID=UPI003F8D7B65
MTPSTEATLSPLPRTEPPFWLPLLAGLPMGLGLLLIAVPLLDHGSATASRTLYLLALALWMLPLTALQRSLWRRGLAGWAMAAVLLPASYAMVLSTKVLSVLVVVWSKGPSLQDFNWWLIFRGLEGAWLALIAYCAIHAVSVYYAELQRAQARHLQSQALLRDAELRALRYQLQPHFLYNTLNAISALVAETRNREARQMLACLGDFLRATLDGAHGHEVALADELALTEAYLDIEKARLGARLLVKWELGPGLLTAQVPYLLLQPLVENAIRHGIAARTAPGRLDIRISDEADRLRVQVDNDLPAEPSHHAGTDDATRAEPVGLRNIGERLANLYPGAHQLSAGIGADGRYRVELSFPLRLRVEPAA